jgi:hypothetical protein
VSEPQIQATLGSTDERPLTAQEFALLQRLLSDPFSIPMVFKTWIVSYLETSNITIPKSAVIGLTRTLQPLATRQHLVVPRVGTIIASALDGGAVPSGMLRCDGTSFARDEQPRLFAAIGTRFGAVDTDHFNVPDLAAAIPGVDFNIVN